MSTHHRPHRPIPLVQRLAGRRRGFTDQGAPRRVKRPRPSRVRLVAASLVWTAGCAAAALVVPGVADASTHLAEAASLEEVITNLRNVIVGLLVGLATLFATIGGVRYILAGGDPAEVEAAKKTLRYAAVGYSVAVLAPVLVKVLQSIVGTP